MQVTFNPEKMINDLTIFEKKDLPSMSVIALNRALFDTRKDLQDAAKRTFDRPVPYTLNSFLYQKAKFSQPEAMLFINESKAKGTAPAEYLLPQITGGRHKATRMQGALLNTIVMDAYGRPTQASQRGKLTLPAIPTRAAPGRTSNFVRVNRYGNMSPGQFTQILSQLRGGISSADVQETGPTVKPQDAGPNTKYVYLNEESLRHDYFMNRFGREAKPGIYFIRHTKDMKRYYRVMTERRYPTYSKKFDFQSIAAINVEKNFVTQLSKILRERRG